MNRRNFLARSAASSVTAFAAATTPLASRRLYAQSPPPLRAAIIGHTGRGNFGHGLDTVWLQLPEAEIVGVADADSDGLAKALDKLKCPATHGFADYREMLAKTKPDFVSVCPRQPDQHKDMTLAAIAAGAKGIYIEKPFCRTPAEADEIITAADQAGAKIAVAHRNRWHPVLPVIDHLIAEDQIGRVLEIRGRGKGDKRGGGEDLWVLGTHVLNLLEYFGGPAKSCSAVLLQNGKPVTGKDVAEGNEALGPLAGDEVHALYLMEKGLVASFDSMQNDGTGGNGFGLQIVGSKGIVNIRCDRDPLAHLIPGNPFEATDQARPWVPITAAGLDQSESDQQKQQVAEVHNHVIPVRDLINCATAENPDRQPLCDARAARQTVEMVTAVFESHRQGGKAVEFPLAERGNALTKL